MINLLILQKYDFFLKILKVKLLRNRKISLKNKSLIKLIKHAKGSCIARLDSDIL